jgi:molybdopterin synthase catalytic subunit/molybdopterin converting factor small subunit
MRVHVLPFGILKEWFGSDAATVELPQGATVADLLERLGGSAGRADRLRGIAVGVNAGFATASQVLEDGDEVALLPPVSGGGARPANVLDDSGGSASQVRLTRERIDAAKFVALAKAAEDGAVVVFDGIVRNNSRGRRTLYLEYEAYEKMALRQMQELAAQARERFAIRRAAIVHRLGRLEIGETSVLIVVSAAHRAAAFDASRWLIDTLKQTVPIWKKEFFADGAVWAPGEPFPAPLAVCPAEAAKNA